MAQKQLGTNPAVDVDIATKAYVDALVGGGGSSAATLIRGTTATATATAAKVVTVSTPSDYTPSTGDMIAVSFTAGQTAASHTLNINGTGAKTVLAGGVAPVALTAYAGANGILFYLYDGTSYHMIGTVRDTNTTYSEISEAEIDAGTASTARAISGRRLAYALTNRPEVHIGTTPPEDTSMLWVDTN